MSSLSNFFLPGNLARTRRLPAGPLGATGLPHLELT